MKIKAKRAYFAGLLAVLLFAAPLCGQALAAEVVRATETDAVVVPASDTDIVIDENAYSLSVTNVTKNDAGLSGTGTLSAAGGQSADELYVRIAVVYENAAGEQILVVNAATVKRDLSFTVPSTRAPYGYAVKNVHLVAVTDDAAVDGAWKPYAASAGVTL